MSPEPRFVEVTYRGLKVAQKARLTEVDGVSFVEHEAPLPVGTKIVIVDGTPREARVTAVVEQEASAKSPPGMRIAWLDAQTAKAPEPVKEAPKVEPPKEAPPPPKEVAVAAKEPEPVPSAVDSTDVTIPVAVPEPVAASTDASSATSAAPDEPPDDRPGGGGNKRKRRQPKKTIIGRPS